MLFASAPLLTTCFGATIANAQTSANADAVYNGWLQAYLVKSGTMTYFANSLSDRSEAFMWGQAYMITGVEDAYDENQAADRKQLVSDLLARFEVKNHADLSWDSWNDDAAWATIALVRGYIITGNATYLSAATQAWDMAYKRGWDSTYGGGIWENMDNVPAGGKCGLSNWPFVISGALIYQSNHDASYLTRSEAIYAWSRANVFDTTTGRVHEQVGPGGVTGDDNAYNSGLIVNAASSLYAITQTQQYYDDAVLAAQHVIGKYPIMTEDHPANGDFGGDQFFRGLGNFARQNKLWSTYSEWLDANANAAWNNRRTDYDISLNNFTKLTPASGNLDAMEAEGSVVVQLVIQTDTTTSGTPSSDAGSVGAATGGTSTTGASGSGVSGNSGAGGASVAGFGNQPIGSGGSSMGGSGGASGTVAAAGNGAAGNATGSGASETGTSSGCGCSEAGTPSRAPGALAFLAVLSLASISRRRKC
jgi:MYXO-CTERM domain-containing protein